MDYLQNVNSSGQRRYAALPRRFFMRPGGGGAAGGSLRSSCQAGVFGNVEEPFEGPIHHRIDVPRLESFIHYQMTQAAIVFHRACV